jgi:hypothetical protein
LVSEISEDFILLRTLWQAGVIMAIDAGFLAVQGVGTGVFFDKWSIDKHL